MPFLSPNQQCQSTEGKTLETIIPQIKVEENWVILLLQPQLKIFIIILIIIIIILYSSAHFVLLHVNMNRLKLVLLETVGGRFYRQNALNSLPVPNNQNQSPKSNNLHCYL